MTNLSNDSKKLDLINMINQHNHFKNLFSANLLMEYLNWRLKDLDDLQINIISITNDIIDYLNDFYYDK